MADLLLLSAPSPRRDGPGGGCERCRACGVSFCVSSAAEKSPGRNTQGRGDPINCRERWIPLSALDATHVSSMDRDFLGKRLLRIALVLTKLADRSAELDAFLALGRHVRDFALHETRRSTVL